MAKRLLLNDNNQKNWYVHHDVTRMIDLGCRRKEVWQRIPQLAASEHLIDLVLCIRGTLEHNDLENLETECGDSDESVEPQKEDDGEGEGKAHGAPLTKTLQGRPTRGA
jgi:hypothetical protein